MVERKGTRTPPRPAKPLKTRSTSEGLGLTGRDRKIAAMVLMRGIATKGGYSGWSHVLAVYEQQHPDDASLRLWASASDRNEIDMICERWRRAQPKRRR